LTVCRIGLSLFLSTLEVTIVSTSLVSITNALNGFDKSSWIVTSYLLTYTGGFLLPPKNFRRLISLGFLLLFAKFSDIFGRKVMLLLALLIFVAFSSVCGASQSMLQLYELNLILSPSSKNLT
jgi:MFS family permease